MFCFLQKQYASGQHGVEIDEKGLETALFEREFIERISVGEMGLAGNRICMNNSSFASTCHLANFDQVVFVSYPLFFQRLSFLLSQSFMQADKPDCLFVLCLSTISFIQIFSLNHTFLHVYLVKCKSLHSIFFKDLQSLSSSLLSKSVLNQKLTDMSRFYTFKSSEEMISFCSFLSYE